jgi:hypothetical protein
MRMNINSGAKIDYQGVGKGTRAAQAPPPILSTTPAPTTVVQRNHVGAGAVGKGGEGACAALVSILDVDSDCTNIPPTRLYGTKDAHKGPPIRPSSTRVPTHRGGIFICSQP